MDITNKTLLSLLYGIAFSCVLFSVTGCGNTNNKTYHKELVAAADSDTLELEQENNEQFEKQDDGTFLVCRKYTLRADENGIFLTVPKLASPPYFVIRFFYPTAVFSKPTLEGIKYYEEYPCYSLSDYKKEKDGSVTYFTKTKELLPICVTEENLPKNTASAYILSEVPFNQVQREIEFENLYNKVWMITLIANQEENEISYGCYSSDGEIFNRIMSGMLHQKLY